MMETLITKVLEFDEIIFFFINRAIKTRTLDVLFSVITGLAEAPFILFLAVILFIFGKGKEKLASVLILFCSLISYLASIALKQIISRPRPIDTYFNISVIGSTKMPSFPSTHSVIIAALVTILCSKYKKMKFTLIPACLFVGISRIYLGHHFPTDVAAGFLLGIIIALLILGIEDLFNEIQKF